MVKYRTAAELPLDLKKVKEEILSTAWKETPSAEKVAKFEMIDMNIQHYLLYHFNKGRGIIKASPEQTLSLLQCHAEFEKPGAQISQAQIKTILDRHIAMVPG